MRPCSTASRLRLAPMLGQSIVKLRARGSLEKSSLLGSGIRRLGFDSWNATRKKKTLLARPKPESLERRLLKESLGGFTKRFRVFGLEFQGFRLGFSVLEVQHTSGEPFALSGWFAPH